MKKIFTLVAAMFVCTAVAQSGVGDDVNYYGVDFSRTRTFSAAEPGWEFKGAFAAINSLILSEWSKYDPGKFLDKNIVVRDIVPTARVNNGIEPAELGAFSSEYRLTDNDIAEMVRLYQLQEREGTGLVIIGELLDKSVYLGGFYVVYFDIASREILSSRQIIGKARGFGLRNYWAGALYSALGSVL